jgi:hypothetical protein
MTVIMIIIRREGERWRGKDGEGEIKILHGVN